MMCVKKNLHVGKLLVEKHVCWNEKIACWKSVCWIIVHVQLKYVELHAWWNHVYSKMCMLISMYVEIIAFWKMCRSNHYLSLVVDKIILWISEKKGLLSSQNRFELFETCFAFWKQLLISQCGFYWWSLPKSPTYFSSKTLVLLP